MSIKEAEEKSAVLLSEDQWLSQVYPNQIRTFDDYIRLSRQIRPLVENLVKDILRTGTNVVMDFPANTVSQREWFITLCEEAESEHHRRDPPERTGPVQTEEDGESQQRRYPGHLHGSVAVIRNPGPQRR